MIHSLKATASGARETPGCDTDVRGGGHQPPVCSRRRVEQRLHSKVIPRRRKLSCVRVPGDHSKRPTQSGESFLPVLLHEAQNHSRGVGLRRSRLQLRNVGEHAGEEEDELLVLGLAKIAAGGASYRNAVECVRQRCASAAADRRSTAGPSAATQSLWWMAVPVADCSASLTAVIIYQSLALQSVDQAQKVRPQLAGSPSNSC